MEEARKELERALKDAELAYRTGAIEYEQNLITAEYTRDSAILTGQQAKDVYDETVASLQSAVTRAEEELQDAEDDIAEYESYVNDGSYKSYFKVDEYQAIYDENLKALTDKMDEWGVGWSQITGGSICASTEAVPGTERYGQHHRHDHPRPGRSTVSETYRAHRGRAVTGIRDSCSASRQAAGIVPDRISGYGRHPFYFLPVLSAEILSRP